MEYVTPGVHIKHVLTEPKRVLRTGVPVFLGLIRRDLLELHNSRQGHDDDNKFIEKRVPKFPTASIARKPGFLRLPKRVPLGQEQQTGDPSAATSQSYMRAVEGAPTSALNLEQIQASAGAAGQTDDTSAEQGKPTQIISDKPQRFTVWPQFAATYGSIRHFGYLTYAVRGFFENYGTLCYVQLICYEDGDMLSAVRAGLQTLEVSSDYDLVCVPDLMWTESAAGSEPISNLREMQLAVIQHCQKTGDRFAILDSPYSNDLEFVKEQREALSGEAAATYYPWLRIASGPTASDSFVPPCGHVAGVYARTDQNSGVHKAPANEELEGVRDLAIHLSDEEQGRLNPHSINCIRAFPRRGIRVWGARTLSPFLPWRYVNVRRIFITAARWIERNMRDVVFEPNTPDLWARIERELTHYFTDLLEAGALAGRSAEEAFYVKCDAETNPPELREVGQVVTEIGLAPVAPTEFIVIRIMHGLTGVRIMGPT